MSAKHEQRRVLLLNGLRDRPPHRSHAYFKVKFQPFKATVSTETGLDTFGVTQYTLGVG